MIKTIRSEYIYNVIDTIPAITGLAEVFSRKPDIKATPDGTYLYMSIVSDNTKTYSNIGYLGNSARIAFTIVCKKSLLSTDTEERVLYDVIDAINNAIVNEGQAKIPLIENTFKINSITEESASPIFTDEKNRAYIVKDYIFNYMAI